MVMNLEFSFLLVYTFIIGILGLLGWYIHQIYLQMQADGAFEGMKKAGKSGKKGRRAKANWSIAD